MHNKRFADPKTRYETRKTRQETPETKICPDQQDSPTIRGKMVKRGNRHMTSSHYQGNIWSGEYHEVVKSPMGNEWKKRISRQRAVHVASCLAFLAKLHCPD